MYGENFSVFFSISYAVPIVICLWIYPACNGGGRAGQIIGKGSTRVFCLRP